MCKAIESVILIFMQSEATDINFKKLVTVGRNPWFSPPNDFISLLLVSGVNFSYMVYTAD